MLLEKLLATLSNMLLSVTATMLQQQMLLEKLLATLSNMLLSVTATNVDIEQHVAQCYCNNVAATKVA